MRRTLPFLFALAVAAACAKPEGAASEGAPAGEDHADAATTGGGVPAGWSARTDRPNQAITEAKWQEDAGKYHVWTGPAHIAWRDADTTSGAYALEATITQMEKPEHPEAFGIFLGGRDLSGDAQRYTYFLVRGTGEILVKVRDGANTTDVVKWTKVDGVPVQDDAGKATYAFAVKVAADSVRFSVNGTQVAAVAAGTVPTDGIAGLRINHSLHVLATPPTITR